MENEKVLTAYHESARVVFAYLNGFSCDVMELPGKGSASNTKLNAGADIKTVQAVMSGNPMALPAEDLEHAIEVAKKLLRVYCAGTCAKIYFENGLKIPAELELDISGQDLTIIQKIQTFLKRAIVDHSDEFPTQTMVSVFRKLKDTDTWKAIEMLADKVLQQDGTLKRFFIEDTLMAAGIEIKRAAARSGFGVGLQEGDEEEPREAETKTSSFQNINTSPLDVMVKDFLKKIKKDWREEELTSATDYLHNVYKKYGQ